MDVTACGVIALVLFGMLGYFRGVCRIAAAFAAFFLAALLAKPASPPLLWLAERGHAVPQALAPLAGQVVAGLLLFPLLYGVAELLLRKREERRERSDRPRIALWERIGGAVLGTAWGLFLVVFVLVGLHLIGNVEGALNPPPRPAPEKAKTPAASSPASARQVTAAVEKAPPPRTPASSPKAPAPAERKFVVLKKQIEGSVFGAVVRKASPASDKVAGTFQDLSIMVNTPALYDEFKRHPAIARFAADPRIRALSEDPQIQRQLQNKQYYDLLGNENIAALLKDKALVSDLQSVNLSAILQEVLGEETAPQTPAAKDVSAATCAKCIGSDGHAKDAFGTEKEALQRVFFVQRETAQPLHTYPCPFGNGWHLTKTKNGP